MTTSNHRESSSFRDRGGFVFRRAGVLYRQVNTSSRESYDCLIDSGLYADLVADGLMIPHEEVDPTGLGIHEAYRVLRPELIPFISYPYEWCFHQLKHAALATLEIQMKALDHGLCLKDASAYNIQFRHGRPVLIDTLSFKCYREGAPWLAYRQFCQHFLGPLALMRYSTFGSNRIARLFVDGVPLEWASSFLPVRTYFRLSVLFHIHLHAKSQKCFRNRTVGSSARSFSRVAIRGIVDSLISAVEGLRWRHPETEWGDYQETLSYSAAALAQKQALVESFLDEVKPCKVWDLGANTGRFSRMASERGIPTIAFDLDPVAVDRNYIESVARRETNLLPLLLDVTNPTPAIGWANKERMSLDQRGPADMVFALALIHHLAIGNNLPFELIADWLARICRHLVIEFVSKEDGQVRQMLATREDIFGDYHREAFEASFRKQFHIRRQVDLDGSTRCLYLMERAHTPA